MLDSIKHFFQVVPYPVWSILAILVILIFISYAWEQVKWWWLNTWMSFPLIGRIPRLSKDLQLINNGPWFQSERAICSAYQEYVNVIAEKDYKNMCAYLAYVDDHGRTPMPKWLLLALVLMVVIEALGFSYVLAGFTIPGASENVQQYGTFGIAIMVSFVLLLWTHKMGEELYQNSIRNTCNRLWVNDRSEKKPLNIRTQTVSLEEPQDIDKDKPDYTRILNRGEVDYLPKYTNTIVGAILIIAVAIGATYVRIQVLDQMLSNEVVSKSEQIHLSGDSLDMGADVKLPAADKAMDIAANNKALENSVDIERHGGWGTFIVLAIIFLGLQWLSTHLGKEHCFYGKDSKKAYKSVGKYTSYADVVAHYNYVCRVAQNKLHDLQQRMVVNGSREGARITPSTKFLDFIAETRKDELNSENFDAVLIAKRLHSLSTKDEKLKLLNELKLTKIQMDEVTLRLKDLKGQAEQTLQLSDELDGML